MSIFASIARRNALFWRLTTKLKWIIRPEEKEMTILPRIVPRHRVAVDVGANMGNYAGVLAGLADQVIAFEPNPSMAQDLRRLLPSNVRVIEAAVSDGQGQSVLRIPDSGSGLATIEATNSLGGATSENVPVRTVTLDGSDLGDVGFIKIDVEGHELAVLNGGQKLLLNSRPILLIEAQDEHRPNALGTVRTFLADFGYSCWYLEGKRLKRLDDHASKNEIYNFIFMPGHPYWTEKNSVAF